MYRDLSEKTWYFKYFTHICFKLINYIKVTHLAIATFVNCAINPHNFAKKVIRLKLSPLWHTCSKIVTFHGYDIMCKDKQTFKKSLHIFNHLYLGFYWRKGRQTIYFWKCYVQLNLMVQLLKWYEPCTKNRQTYFYARK